MFAESLTPLMRPAKQVKLSPVPVTKVDETVFDAPPYEPGEGEEGDDSFLILHDGGRSMSDERSASSSSIHQEEEPVAEAHQEEQEQHENQENQGQQYDNWFEEMEQKYGMLSDVELSAVIQGAIDFLKACAVTKPETDKITDYMNLLQSIAKFAQGYSPLHIMNQC